VLNAPFEGGCECSGVRYRCTALPFVSYTCHCHACQRITGSAFATCIQVPVEALEVLAGTPGTFTRKADSGNILTTSICNQCGSALFVANSGRPRTRTIYVGTLDDPTRVEVNAHIWVSRRLPWVVLPTGHRIFQEVGDFRADYASNPSRLLRE